MHKRASPHGDFDHMGEAKYLVENFKVEKVIFNCGKFNDLKKEPIKVLDKKKIKYYSCIKELNVNKNKLFFLQTKFMIMKMITVMLFILKLMAINLCLWAIHQVHQKKNIR